MVNNEKFSNYTFLYLPPVSTTPVAKKFKTAVMGYSDAWGKLIQEKT
jgi:hypothetical protein